MLNAESVWMTPRIENTIVRMGDHFWPFKAPLVMKIARTIKPKSKIVIKSPKLESIDCSGKEGVDD